MNRNYENTVIKKMNHSEPLSPEEVKQIRPIVIIPEVFQSVNEFLCTRFNGRDPVRITQTELTKSIMSKCNKEGTSIMTHQKLISDRHLDFEEMYNKSGWKVSFSSPDRDESFDSFFYFEPKYKK